MKKLLILLILPIFCNAQNGIWGIGVLGTHELRDYANLKTTAAYRGYQVDFVWSDIEALQGVYNFSTIDSKLNEVKDSGLYVGLSVSVNQDCPSWLKTLVGTYSTGNGIAYPKAYDTRYKSAFCALLKHLSQHLSTMPWIYEWQIKWGTTGDTGPWHGTLASQFIGDPLVPQGEDITWKAFYHSIWDSVISYNVFYHLDTSKTHLLFNSGNDHEDNALVWSKSHSYFIKEGNLSHTYSFDGQGLYAGLEEDQISRGEVQGFIFTSAHKNKEAFQLIVTASALGLSMFNTPSGWKTNVVGSDTRTMAFFNRYSNASVYNSHNAFIELGSFIGPDSLIRWTETQYGKLIKFSDQTTYTNAINNINSDQTTSNDYKANLRMQRTITYTNSNRLDSLFNFSGTNAIRNIGAADDWDNDFVWSPVDNYSKWIIQNNSKTTSTLSFRDGVDSSLYGRIDKEFLITDGTAPDMTFDIDNNFDSAARRVYMTFQITYLDSGGGSWGIKADTGKGMISVFTNTNVSSHEWITRTIQINNFQLGTADDYHLYYIGGGNTKFSTIELSAISESTFYHDADGDGYGNSNDTLICVSPPLGYVGRGGDCNDNNILVNPSVTELCNGIDDNCNGVVDEGCVVNYNVNFSSPSYYAKAIKGNIKAMILLSRVATSDVTVNYQTSDGTALSGKDYYPAKGSVTIHANYSSATVTIQTYKPKVVNSKYFNLTLTGTSSNGTLIVPAVALMYLTK